MKYLRHAKRYITEVLHVRGLGGPDDHVKLARALDSIVDHLGATAQGEVEYERGRLRGAAVYLAGPMTATSDLGAGWRADLAKDLRKLGLVVFDPCNKAIEIGSEDADARKNLHENHKNGNFSAVQKQMKIIRRVDLRCVDLASFVICRLDGSPTVGTYEELAMATLEQKPIFLWLDGELTKATCNPWLMAQIDPDFIFESKQELLDYFHTLDTCPDHPGHRKIMLFDFVELYKDALRPVILEELNGN